jgi:hypothetical protein
MNSYSYEFISFESYAIIPVLDSLSTFGQALTLWLRKTLKEGSLKIINKDPEIQMF